MLKRIGKYTALTLVAAFVVLYIGDYATIEVRAKFGHAFGTVRVEPTYAIPQKNGQAEFVFGEPHDQTCVHSLFPHFDDTPCWYLNRTATKPIAIS